VINLNFGKSIKVILSLPPAMSFVGTEINMITANSCFGLEDLILLTRIKWCSSRPNLQIWLVWWCRMLICLLLNAIRLLPLAKRNSNGHSSILTDQKIFLILKLDSVSGYKTITAENFSPWISLMVLLFLMCWNKRSSSNFGTLMSYPFTVVLTRLRF